MSYDATNVVTIYGNSFTLFAQCVCLREGQRADLVNMQLWSGFTAWGNALAWYFSPMRLTCGIIDVQDCMTILCL